MSKPKISYDYKYIKGTAILKKRKLGLVFYKPKGRAAYKITKKLQILDYKTNKINTLWFAHRINSIGYYLDGDRGQTHEAWRLERNFGWQIQGDIVEAVEAT